MITRTDIYNAFADSVLRIMEDPERPWRKPGEGQANDFCALGVAGENLRRLIEGHFEEDDGRIPPRAVETLEKYDRFLSKYEGDVPTSLEDDLESILLDLRAYAKLTGQDRKDCYEQACCWLDEMEQVLMIAAAAWRGRRAIDESVVLRMGNRACEAISEIEVEIRDLADFAWDREMPFGSDPNFIGLYAFWDQIHWYSKANMTVAKVVRDAARREKLIEQVVASDKKKRENGTP